MLMSINFSFYKMRERTMEIDDTNDFFRLKSQINDQTAISQMLIYLLGTSCNQEPVYELQPEAI